MKKLITLTTLCIIASILISSCKSGTSITKRRYNKGYYVSHTSGKHKVSGTTENVAQMKPITPLLLLKNDPSKEVLANPSTEVEIQNDRLTAKANSKTQTNSALKDNKQPVLKFKNITIAKPINQIKQSFYHSKSGDDGTRDGLSLFWIIILVILILWALGLLTGGFGLGGLINLLLLVALILIILWLLRIV